MSQAWESGLMIVAESPVWETAGGTEPKRTRRPTDEVGVTEKSGPSCDEACGYAVSGRV